MNCKGVIKELSDYLNGELDASLKQALERHLEDCDDCRVVVDTTRKTIDIYCHCEPMPLPPGVRERLQRALTQRLGKRS